MAPEAVGSSPIIRPIKFMAKRHRRDVFFLCYDNVMRILAFGDSITYGAWDSEAGWVERVKRYAHGRSLSTNGQRKIQVLNLGIGGDTSTKLLKRMPSEIEARYSASWPFVFIISVGTNDERTINGQIETTPENYRSNLQEIVSMAKKHTEKILLLGLPPLGKALVEFKGQKYSDDKVKEYDDILKNVAIETNTSYFPLRSVFESSGIGNLFVYDDLHPNDSGHELIAKQVIGYLENI